MTDKQQLIALCEKMGLKPAEEDELNPYPGHDEFWDLGDRIVIGAGRGYSGFFAEFRFDDDGNILDHKLAE